MKLKSICAAVALLSSSSAFAFPVTVDTQVGESYNMTSLASYTTGVNDMIGMEITAQFNDGSSDVAILGSSTASGDGWSASFIDYSTFSSPWYVEVENTSTSLITSLIFSGASGDTIFDIKEGSTYTPGSASGKSISSGNTTYSGNTVTSIAATYINQVSLNGIFYGDLYETLRLDFTDGLATGDSLKFITDADNSALKGDIVAVPAPASLALLGLALVGLTTSRRKKK